MKVITRLVMACIDVIRPVLGPRECCIYPVTCRQYAQEQLEMQPWYRALPRIALRILGCNPVTRLLVCQRKR